MLHNTGPYGPNEPPVNMGAPVNMTQMSGHMNLAHNINNLSKMAPQVVPPPSGHYNLPDYPPYSHSPLGMPPQMPQFPNYQPLGFQHGYTTNHNANPINDLSWQNGMFPMNLNMQNEHNVNVMNYAYDKRLADSGRHENAYDKRLEDSGRHENAYDKRLADSGRHENAYDKRLADSVRQENAYDKRLADSVRQENAYDKRLADSGRHENAYDKRLADSGRHENAYEKRLADSGRHENAYEKRLADSGRHENAYDKRLADSGRHENAYNKKLTDSVRQENAYDKRLEDSVRQENAYDKRLADSVRQEKEQNMRTMELNIPQIPNKAYTKQMDNSYVHEDLYQNTHNLDLSMKTQEKIQLDSTRRKNIEHTVKLIENILIQSSKPREVSPKLPEELDLPDDDDPDDDDDDNEPSDMTIVNVNRNVTKPTKIPETTSVDPLSLSPKEATKELSNTDNEKSNSSADPDYKNDSEEESSSEEEDIKPIGITERIKPEEKTEIIDPSDSSVVIKIEKASWADTECFTPFLKDYHGFQGDEQINCRIIDGENSVTEAVAAYQNAIKPEGVFECPHCSLLFKHPKRFLIHNKWHTFGLTNEKRNEIAKVREQRREQRKEAKILERMQSNEVTDVPVDGKVYPCKDCDKVFSAKGSLKNHRKRTHPTRIRECKICHKVISSWMALRAHIATHTADSGAGYQCSKCPKRFKYSHSLAKHSDTHLEKTHGCAECPKKFGSAQLLKMHMKTHERVQRGATYRCTYCGKGFFESYSLQVHERTHRNERPYTCDICNTSYGTNSSLKRHVKVSHNAAKPYQCSVCKRNFITELIRDRHEVRLHGNPEDFKFPCKQCDCKYTKFKDLQKHVYKTHPKGKRKKKAKSSSDSE